MIQNIYAKVIITLAIQGNQTGGRNMDNLLYELGVTKQEEEELEKFIKENTDEVILANIANYDISQ